MGEIVELVTWPKSENVYYKITSNSINFDVKATSNAGIGLSRKPGEGTELIVAIGQNRHSWIINKVHGRIKSSVETPNILSGLEYRRFWISWYGNFIRLGRDADPNPIVKCTCSITNLKYVTFSAIEENEHPVYWKVELPPVLHRPLLKPITDGEMYWVPVNAGTKFPEEAFVGGFQNENLYIIRAKHLGSLTPGKFVASEGLGYIGWSHETHVKQSFEVLCGFDCSWVQTSDDRIPVGAVIGGYSENQQREKLYIGRAKYLDHIIPGKVQTSHNVCFIPFDGKEIAIKNYEILVVPQKTRCANNFLMSHINMNPMIEEPEVEHFYDDGGDDDDDDDDDDHDHDNDNDDDDDNSFHFVTDSDDE